MMFVGACLFELSKVKQRDRCSLCPSLIHAYSQNIGDRDLSGMLTCTRPEQGQGCLHISLTFASQTAGSSVREPVHY